MSLTKIIQMYLFNTVVLTVTIAGFLFLLGILLALSVGTSETAFP